MDLESLKSLHSDALYKILASSVDGFTLLNSSGHILDVNNSYCRMVGYSQEELLNLHISNIDAIDTPEDVATRFEKVILSGSLRFESKQRCKNGSILDVEVTANYSLLFGGSFFSFVRDITEQKNAEIALRNSETKLSAIFHASPDSININRLADGVFVDVNAGFVSLFGYSSEDIIGMPSTEIGVWVDPENRHFLARQLKEQGYVSNLEAQLRCKDGSILTVLVSSRLIEISGDLCTLNIARDITEYNQMQDSLRVSEERFRLFMDNSPTIAWIKDEQGRHVYLSKTYQQRFGVTLKDYRDQTDYELWSPECAEQFRKNDLCVLSTNLPIEVIEETENSDGSKCYWLSTKFPFIDPSGQKFVAGIASDITDRKVAEEKLAESEKKYRLMVESAGDSISVMDFEGKMLTVNPTACRMLGYTYDELISLSADKIDAKPEEINGNALTLMETGYYSGESEFVRKDGSTVPVSIDARKILWEGHPAILSICRDITDRKKSESERLELERQLLHAHKLESLGVMAGGIAHDFNNLLQSILGNMELATSTLESESESQKHIFYATKAAKRASHLTNLMLTYAGKGFVTKKNLNLNDMIREYIDLLRSAATTSVAIKLSLFAELPDVRANEAQIQQILMNLISNGSESIDSLDGCISISTGVTTCDHQYLDATLLHENVIPGNFVYIDVSDNGCGMGKDTLKRLLDPFFTTKFTGRGLGMSVVMGILKSHGGTLLVDSEPGRGTAIRVLLPVLDTFTPAVALAAVSSFDDARMSLDEAFSGVALVVDDERHVLKTCAKMVELAGFRVITAHDGLDAVATYREYQDEIDLVLMDLTMPKMDGLTAMAGIYEIRPDIKVILASGFNQEELSERITGKAPSGFIRKPYSMSVLSAELHRVMAAELSPEKT